MKIKERIENKNFLLNRQEKLYRQLEEFGLDGLLISNQINITYLTGFPSRESYLLFSKKGNFFITDFRYLEESKENLKGFIIKQVRGSLFKLIGELADKLKLKNLGFESKHLAFAEFEEINKQLPKICKFVCTYDILESLRQIKTEDEIKKIRTAVEIAIEAFEYIREFICLGKRESEIAEELRQFIRRQGADKVAFDIIVAAGRNSAFPHYNTGNRDLRPNEIVLIDMGVDYEGYKSDLTRVFFLGKITPIVKRTYSAVMEARNAAIRQIKPGFLISNLDKVARQYITRKGYGRFFGHSLGHGIGLEVHEEPHISKKNKNCLKKGMVFTIEPAIYLPNKFGIRIEDMVLVTKKGAEILSGTLFKSI